jgi:hypothetical protein
MHQCPKRWTGRASMSAVGALIAIVALLLTACSGSDSRATPTSTDPEVTSAPPTTSPSTPEGEVLAAYQEFWQVWLRANNPPNPNYPDLAKVATGLELGTVRTAIQKSVDEGTFTTLPTGSHYRHQAEVKQINGNEASVQDCAIDDSQIIQTVSGAIVNGDVVTQLLVSSVVRSNAVWQVTNVQEQAKWRGAVPCA